MGHSMPYLPGAALPDAAKTVALTGLLPLGLGVFGIDHTMGALFAAARGLSTESASGQYIVPVGHEHLNAVPESARRYFTHLSSSSVIEVSAVENNSYWITRQDGTRQWLRVDKTTNEVTLQQSHALGVSELTIKKDGS